MSAPLFAYQQAGINLGSSTPCSMLRIPPGGGKSRIVCETARGLGETSMLWISPVTPIPHIVRQIQQWGAPYWRIAPVTSGSIPARADVLVVPYSQLNNEDLMRALMARRWDRLVIDEAHYVKSLRAQRTQALYGERVLYKSGGLIDVVRRITVMSGTLAPNGDPLELYPHLRAVFPRTILNAKGGMMGERAFGSYYTIGSMTSDGWVTVRPQHMHELREHLKPYLLNVPQNVVDQYLPPFQMDWYPLEISYGEDLAELLCDQRTCDIREQIEATGRLRPGSDEHLATVMRLIGLAKVPSIVDEVRNFFMQEPHRKLVLFARHIEVIRKLHDALASFNPQVLFGAVPAKEREARIQRFRTDHTAKIFLAQIHTAGTGFDLVEARDAWFAELWWNPSDLFQAAKRTHRPGQQHPVQCRLFSLLGTLDDACVSVIKRKRASIQAVFD